MLRDFIFVNNEINKKQSTDIKPQRVLQIKPSLEIFIKKLLTWENLSHIFLRSKTSFEQYGDRCNWFACSFLNIKFVFFRHIFSFQPGRSWHHVIKKKRYRRCILADPLFAGQVKCISVGYNNASGFPLSNTSADRRLTCRFWIRISRFSMGVIDFGDNLDMFFHLVYNTSFRFS